MDYDALFCQTIRRALEEVDSKVLYLDSSPSNGLVCSEPYVKRWLPRCLRAELQGCQLVSAWHRHIDPALSIWVLMCRWGDVQSPHRGDVSVKLLRCSAESSSVE